MSAFLSRLFLATALCALPAAAMADSHDDAEAGAATAEETTAETETADEADDEPAEAAAAEGEDGEQTDEWANKMRKRHHEGDVALGVCGARMCSRMYRNACPCSSIGALRQTNRPQRTKAPMMQPMAPKTTRRTIPPTDRIPYPS